MVDEPHIAKELLKRLLKGEITQEQFQEACKKWQAKVDTEPIKEDEPVEDKILKTFGGSYELKEGGSDEGMQGNISDHG